MEKNFDTRSLLKNLYDFAGGQPCGASYISASKTCRVGAGDMLAATKEGKLDAQAARLADSLSDRTVAEIGVPKDEIVAVSQLHRERATEIVERLESGKVSQAEVEEYLVKHVDFDIANSEFVFIGMENGLAPEDGMAAAPNAKSAGQATLASQMAVDKMVSSGEASLQQVSAGVHSQEVQSLADSGKTFTPNHFIGVANDIANNATTSGQLTAFSGDGTPFFAGNKMATIEMNVAAANTVAHGSVDRTGKPRDLAVKDKNGKVVRTESSMDPNKSQYGALYNGQGGDKLRGVTRNFNEKNISAKRAEFVGSELKRAAAGDKFRGGMAAPGGANSGNYRNFRQGVMDPLARSGTPVYETKVTLTTGSGSKMRSKDHTLHVMELSPGKYFVLGDFSLNTPGYGANRNHIQAYREAVASVRSGKAKKYVPSPTKAKSTSSKSKASKGRETAAASRQSKKRTESQTKKDAAKRVKSLTKDIKSARTEMRDTKPGSPRNVNAKNRLTDLKASLKIAEEEAA